MELLKIYKIISGMDDEMLQIVRFYIEFSVAVQKLCAFYKKTNVSR